MPTWVCWARLFPASSFCAGEVGVISQLATQPVFSLTRSQLCLQALIPIFYPSLSQILCALIFPQALLGSLSSSHASCSVEGRRGGSCTGSSLIQGALAVLSSICWRGCPPEGPKFLPFHVVPRSSTTCCRGERWLMENLVWSVWCRVAGESWNFGHYSVACIIPEIWGAVFHLFQGHWASLPWLSHPENPGGRVEWDPSMDRGEPQ